MNCHECGDPLPPLEFLYECYHCGVKLSTLWFPDNYADPDGPEVPGCFCSEDCWRQRMTEEGAPLTFSEETHA